MVERPKRPAAGSSSGRPPRRRRTGAGSIAKDELVAVVGAKRASRLASAVNEAADAFAGERYGEARTLLGPVVSEAPGAATVRELFGLTLYRLERWRDAIRELEAFSDLAQTTEQHPVLMDCYRALKRWPRVEELWEELRSESPSAALVTEGRIVMAGACADRGDLDEALNLLSRGFTPPNRADEYQLRRAYALADVYERVGDVPTARKMFIHIASVDPSFADAAERAAGLG